MAHQFPPDVEELIREHMAQGNYQDEGELLRDALEALAGRKADLAAIQGGIEDMEAGRVRPLREFDREFRAKKNIPQDG